MLTDQQWAAVEQLVGLELRTLKQQRPFTVVSVEPSALWVRVSTEQERRIRRLRFDQALSLGIPVDQLTTVSLQPFGSRQASYVVAILHALRERGIVCACWISPESRTPTRPSRG
jgi:hypothetical protein